MGIIKKKDEDNDMGMYTCSKCGSTKVTSAGPTTFAGGIGNAGINMRTSVTSQNFTMFICGNCGNNFRPDN